MSDLELCYLSATEALTAFRKKSLAPVELLNAQLARIAAVGSDINAFSFLYADDAIAAAKEAERRYSSGRNVRPLEGIPVAIKDESLIAGKITTFGSLIFQDEVGLSPQNWSTFMYVFGRDEVLPVFGSPRARTSGVSGSEGGSCR